MSLPDPMPLALPDRESFTRDGIARVETTTLLPGGALTTLTVRRTGAGFSVDDEGGARSALRALGLSDLTAADARRGADIARRLGVVHADDTFLLREVASEQLPAAIAYVAEAGRAWAAATVEAHQKSRQRSLVGRAVDRLKQSFPENEVQAERELPGISTKLHRFDIVVSLSRERFAVFETLLPVASSIAAAHLKFYDLMQAHPDWPREALVEDLVAWAYEDLAIVQQVATGIRSVAEEWNDLSALAA